MNLEKLFGSKTKVDILKYLIFRRQGISMRALESDLWWTFPAIKKQVDSLNESWIIFVDKDDKNTTWYSIYLVEWIAPILKELFFESLKQNLILLFNKDEEEISNYFRGNKFWKPIGVDLILIHNPMEKQRMEELKIWIETCFRDYWIESTSIVFMETEEWEKRYRLADRFVLQVMQYYKNI